MTLNPILKVLSTLSTHDVRFLLMGGQACIFYEGTDFSVDTDIVIVADAANLERLTFALDELQAKVIAVPPFEADYLRRGHAIHFRCFNPEAEETRLDVMASMRGVDPFGELWKRRTTAKLQPSLHINMLGLADLIQAKKTQRDKDWIMIRKLLARHYRVNEQSPTQEQVAFWLREGRSAQMLRSIAARFPEPARKTVSQRPLVEFAISGDIPPLNKALVAEERAIRQADRAYWTPLKKELEELRLHRKRRKK